MKVSYVVIVYRETRCGSENNHLNINNDNNDNNNNNNNTIIVHLSSISTEH